VFNVCDGKSNLHLVLCWNPTRRPVSDGFLATAGRATRLTCLEKLPPRLVTNRSSGNVICILNYRNEFVDLLSRYLLRCIHSGYRSQWPRGLRHELSSLARMLGSWVRIPLKTRMSVMCAFTLCLCCSVIR
jgi:hypothetical protein